jgi:hypothetical protein
MQIKENKIYNLKLFLVMELNILHCMHQEILNKVNNYHLIMMEMVNYMRNIEINILLLKLLLGKIDFYHYFMQ